MKTVGISKIGLVRQLNEDRFFMQDPLLIVTDGMGGHVGGEIASTMAIDEISKELEEKIKKQEVISEKDLAEAILSANRVIFARINKEKELFGMGTTAVIAYYANHKIYWASVGDSRLYHFINQKLIQITTDHSIVQSLVDEGKLDAKDMISHPQRNLLTRAVGVDKDLKVDSGVFPVLEGEKVLLCSDGLTGYIGDEQIEEILRNEDKDERSLEDLVELVYNQGAKDNVTIIIGTVEE